MALGRRPAVGAGGWVPPPVEALAEFFPEFTLERLLGRGGMSAVYLARHRGLDQLVALKLLPPELGLQADLVERFRRETLVLARIRHPNVVEIFDSGVTTSGHLWFTMEHVEGGDLARSARTMPVSPGSEPRGLPGPPVAVPGPVPDPPVNAVTCVREIALALEAIHGAGVVHRDLKPSNVLLTLDGRVKVSDFGVAGLADDAERHRLSRLTLTGTVLGTFEYAAPEQLAGGIVDRRSDIFSLGVLTYELLTGQLPRGAFEPPSVAAGVDPAFDAVVLTALQPDPRRRYPEAAAFRQAWERASDTRANARAREQELRARLRRRTRLVAGLAAAVLVVAGLAVFGGWQRREAVAHMGAAISNRADAERLVNYLLVGFTRQLNDINRQDLLEETHRQLEDYFRRVPEAADDDGRESRRVFFSQRGLVFAQRFKFAEAREAVGRAVALAREQARLHPTNETCLLHWIETENQVGLHLARQARSETNAARRIELREQALAQFEVSRAALTSFTNTAATAPLLIIAAETHRVPSNTLKALGRTNQCEAWLGIAQGLLARALDLNPPADVAAGARDSLALLHGHLGRLAHARADFTNALRHAERYTALSRELLPPGPELNVTSHGQVAEAITQAGEALNGLRRGPEAVEQLRSALALWDQLVPLAGTANPYPVRYRLFTLAALVQATELAGSSGDAGGYRRRAEEDQRRLEAMEAAAR